MSPISVSKSKVITGHRDCVYTIEEGGSSNIFFSGAGDGMVVKWDIENPENGELIAKLPNSVYAVHFHEPSNILIVGHNYDGIHMIDWKKKKELSSLHISDAAIFDIKSINNYAIIAFGNGEIVIVDLLTNSIVHKAQPCDKSARSIAVHPEKMEYSIGFSDHVIRVYNAQTHELKIELKEHANSIFTLQYSDDGNKLLSSGRDAQLKIWDSKSYTLIESIAAHMYAINHVVFNPSQTLFATCSMDKSIKIWDALTHKLLKVIDKSRHAGHATSVNKLLWTAHNDHLISASDDRTISVWDIKLT